MIKYISALIILVRQAGFEPATYGLEGRCSIQLSYWRMWFADILKVENEINTLATLPASNFYMPPR